MNEAIIQRHNEVVKNDDTVYVLGDLMLGPDIDKGLELIGRLNGHICFIRGNHDIDNRVQAYLRAFIVCMGDAYSMKYNGYHFYLSHYPTITANNDYDKPLKARVINLCGHYHTKNPFIDWGEKGMTTYHVEMDAHNCYPVNIKQIIEEMKQKILESTIFFV